MSGVVVVDRRSDWPLQISGMQVLTAWEYLTQAPESPPRNTRVYNLCRSFGYQTTGYYVSLLGGARGHRLLPDVMTIQDLKLAESPSVLNDEIEELIQSSLSHLSSEQFTLNVYFGTAAAKRHDRLARALFNLFPAPLLETCFALRDGRWHVTGVAAIALGEVPDAHREALIGAAKQFFSRRRSPGARRKAARFDLAILVNPKEAEPPSNARALKRFEKAAKGLGMDVDFIDKSDYGHVAEYDALFIRETTAVNHHTYRFARRAAREGLIVLDDPVSILRATNKVFLAELMDRHRIPQPQTLLIHRGNVSHIAEQLGFPCVLKQPDSQFSRGVIKVENSTELRRLTRELLERSDIIIAQSFEPTEYDWRVGVLDGEPLYACRYFMAQGHWQVVHREGSKTQEGEHETIDVVEIPDNVRRIAVQAARAVGNGLYGVDLKQIGTVVKVIEVNDNPNIDYGVEDLYLGEVLYQRIMQYFLRRLEERTQDRRIT